VRSPSFYIYILLRASASANATHAASESDASRVRLVWLITLVCVCVCVLSHWVHAAKDAGPDLPALKCFIPLMFPRIACHSRSTHHACSLCLHSCCATSCLYATFTRTHKHTRPQVRVLCGPVLPRVCHCNVLCHRRSGQWHKGGCVSLSRMHRHHPLFAEQHGRHVLDVIPVVHHAQTEVRFFVRVRFVPCHARRRGWCRSSTAMPRVDATVGHCCGQCR
jgi:hypothetical protein